MPGCLLLSSGFVCREVEDRGVVVNVGVDNRKADGLSMSSSNLFLETCRNFQRRKDKWNPGSYWHESLHPKCAKHLWGCMLSQ